jgi:hypothetical protein
MRKYLNIALIMMLSFMMANAASAQAGPSEFPFLKIDTDNRSAAMGGTQLSHGNTAMTAFTNPAMLSEMDGLNVATGMTNWIADIRHFGGALTYNAGSAGSFGFTGVWMDYGTFTQRFASSGTSEGFIDGGYTEGNSFNVAEFMVGLAYGRQVTGNLQMGAHLKYAGQSMPAAIAGDAAAGDALQDRSRNGILLDVGTVYYPGFKDLRFGASLKNLSNGQNAESVYGFAELPAALSIGGAMDLLQLVNSSGDNQLTMAFEWLQEPEYEASQHLGMEYGLMNRFFVRGGYRFNADIERLTAGFGMNLGFNDVDMVVDYAYSSFGETFGSVHRFSIGFGL